MPDLPPPLPPASAPSQARPLRAMLARGAACDLCRARKVKCDGARPVCGQCIKSARGNLTEINCVYEGGAAARAGGKKRAAAHPPSTTTTTTTTSASSATPSATVTVKRKRDRELDDDDDDDEEEYLASLVAPRGDDAETDRKDVPPPPASANGIKKRATGGGHRVETLVERISELERRLRLQSQPVPAAVHTHVRASASPPFYPTPYLPSLAPPASSAPMEARRSMSNEPSAKDIAAAWTPESSLRFTAAPPPPRGQYASFIPPLPHLAVEGIDDVSPSSSLATAAPQAATANTATTTTAGITIANFGRQPAGGFNGSSYPPLNYSPSGLAMTNGATSDGAPALSHSASSTPSSSNGWCGTHGTTTVAYPTGFESLLSASSATSTSTHATTTYHDLELNLFGAVHDPSPSSHSAGTTTPGGAFVTPAPSPPPPPPPLLPTSSSAASVQYASLDLDPSLLQLFYPSWPASLPAPSVVLHLVTTFFARAPVAASMLSRPRFLAALGKPPTDRAFPETALLHAVCAYASNYVSPEAVGGAGRYWAAAAKPGPREYHYAEARKGIDKALTAGEGGATHNANLFQILQATLLCCYLSYLDACFTDLWMLSGLATRLCTPLGLNHLPAWDWETNACGPPSQDWRAMLRALSPTRERSLLPEPEDVEEHYERAATWWVAFSIDRHTSASTDWSTSIDELDVSTPLPLRAFAPRSATFIREEKFLSSSAPALGSHGLFLKAVILLGRVVNFLQRMPRHATMLPTDTCETYREKVKATPDFQDLDRALAKFRALTSGDFFDSGSAVDGYLTSAYAVPHAASILLHEPFCSRTDRSPTSSVARCYTSAKCVMNSTYVLYQSSNDLATLDPFIGYVWTVVGRSLVRDYAIKRLWGDNEGAQTSKTFAEHCLLFTQHCSTTRGVSVPVLSLMTKNLQALLDDPNQLLPPTGVEMQQSCGCPS